MVEFKGHIIYTWKPNNKGDFYQLQLDIWEALPLPMSFQFLALQELGWE